MFSTNIFNVGVNYSANGGWSANYVGASISKNGMIFDPSIGASLPFTFVKNNYESPADLCKMKDSNFKSKEEMLADLKEKGFESGTKDINEFKYKEWDGESKEAGKTRAVFRGSKLRKLSITMLPHKTSDMFYESFNHELIHAYDYVNYGLTNSISYKETKAYRYTDRFKSYSSMPSKYQYNGKISLSDMPDYLVPTKTPYLKPKFYYLK